MPQKVGPGDLPRSERGKMGGRHLAVDQLEVPLLQLPHEHGERNRVRGRKAVDGDLRLTRQMQWTQPLHQRKAGKRQIEGLKHYLTFNMGGSMTTSVVMVWG